MSKILLAGESWVSHTTHIKGMDVFHTCTYQEGGKWLIGALEQAGIEVVYLPNHSAPEQFPYTAEELRGYDAVILSDIGSNTLLLSDAVFVQGQTRPNRLELLRAYVEEGGGLCMIGGYLSFAGMDCKARYGQTPLAPAIPVQMLDVDDRRETCEGIRPRTEKADSVVLKGIDGEWPTFLGYNKTDAMPQTEIAATINGDPFLVLGRYGKGRTAAFTSDCSPHWATMEFVHWKHYPLLWQNLAGYLSGTLS